MTTNSNPVIDQIRRSLNWLIVATIVLYITISVVAVTSYTSTSRNTQALCTLRTDLEVRVQTSEQFLHEHPGGFAGISKATIKTSLDGQRRTIKALKGLSC